MEENERERLEQMLEAITLAGNAEQVREEIAELRQLAKQAQAVEAAGAEPSSRSSRVCSTVEGSSTVRTSAFSVH